MKKTIFKNITLFLSSMLMTATINVCANAQSASSNSNGKEVAFSFYKTVDATPNFERWIKSTHPYLSTPQAKSEQVLREQKTLMREQFSKFNPAQYPIRLNLDTKLSLHPTEELEENVLNVHFEFSNDGDDAEEMFFFPFDYAGDHFAVIIEDFDQWERIEMPLERFAFMQGHINADREVNVVMELIPTSADIENPLDVGDTPHWLMSTKIGSFIAYSQTGVQLYAYAAPWYLSPVQEEITGLKSIQDEIAKELDIKLDPILMPVPTNN